MTTRSCPSEELSMEQRKPKKPCAGCIHYHAYFRANLCCNYIFNVGHRRPCPPGAECTVKEPRRTGGASVGSKTEQKF